MVPFGDSLRRLRDKVLMNEEERREEAIHTVPPLPPCPSSAVIAEPVPSSTSRSAFFQHLPAEVRQRILEAAFGDQTVHMHLSIERPLLRKYRHKNRNSLQSNSSSSSSSNDKLQGHGWHPGRSAWDTAARPHWVWRSSVCHFGCFPHESWQCRAPEWSGWPIKKDFCVAGESCELPGSPGSCGVGATGWLLACRRAYREGMPVLYAAGATARAEPREPDDGVAVLGHGLAAAVPAAADAGRPPGGLQLPRGARGADAASAGDAEQRQAPAPFAAGLLLAGGAGGRVRQAVRGRLRADGGAAAAQDPGARAADAEDGRLSRGAAAESVSAVAAGAHGCDARLCRAGVGGAAGRERAERCAAGAVAGQREKVVDG
ncbi:hypothetical protein PWT90_03071 [Aphanocladium album]|nr:hypothetical protein PWT90_03071 [Aphanocladium album]